MPRVLAVETQLRGRRSEAHVRALNREVRGRHPSEIR